MKYNSGVIMRGIMKRRLRLLALCAACILINILGVQIARVFQLPIYLDSVGIFLASALGGYVPGVAVGFLSNLINGLSDAETAYYGVLSVINAVAAAYFSRKKILSRFPHVLLAVLVFSLVGGGLGSVLTWLLYGLSFGTGTSARAVQFIYAHGVTNQYLAQLLGDLATDMADKAVAVALVLLILRLVPQRLQEMLNFHHWRDNSWSGRAEDQALDRCRVVSLKIKIVGMISSATIVIALVVTYISYVQYKASFIDGQIGVAQSVASLAAHYIDADKVPLYLEQGEAAVGYLDTKQKLETLMAGSEEIEFVYVYQILPDGCHVVFDPDTEEVKGEPPGTVIDFDEAFADVLPQLFAGERIEPVISNETYGYLLTLYEPVYDSQGVCQCYAAVDISMPRLVATGRIFLTKIISLFVGFFITLLTAAVHIARYKVIEPINDMARAAGSFAYDSEEARSSSLQRIQNLDIRTGDELENLYLSLARTTEDTVRYITEAQKKSEVISKLQSGMIMVLADLVESRDQCTGDHVRKTAAYAKIIMEQMKKDGVYADQMTDTFINDVYNSAPLHDVGKIQVSDVLLNKPGKLTDEEFKQMRDHTTRGAEIIERAINIVSEGETSYLNEAKNLAAYHHERWDGKGYPNGLAGEDIPLSARIMAVADVFDALVSRRSYKPGFPIEKALQIIREGAGSHFDPKIAACFLRAEEQVRRVAEENKDV